MNDKEYREWETKVEATRKINNLLLSDFEKWLKSKNLKAKTLKNHHSNIDFFINNYLLHYEIISAKAGTIEIGGFLGDYFIRKTSWASKYTIQENIASFKKFYKFLNEIGELPDKELVEMNELIKYEKDYWIEEVESYYSNIDIW